MNHLDAAFARQAAFEPIDFISFLARSALFCVPKGGHTRGTNAWRIPEKKFQTALLHFTALDPIGRMIPGASARERWPFSAAPGSGCRDRKLARSRSSAAHPVAPAYPLFPTAALCKDRRASAFIRGFPEGQVS
jgi:hypothetical protein